MRVSRRVRIVGQLALAGALLLAFAAPGLAQTETGRVTGLVLDQTGAVLPGATVTLTGTGTGVARTTVTDEAGRYVISNLQPGPYTAKVELSGFTTQTANLVLNVGGSVSIETKLQIAGATETVSVVAESQIINTQNSEVSTTVRQEQIRELPTITRNAYDLVGLAGNVAADNESGRGTGYAINGMRSASTNVLLDGFGQQRRVHRVGRPAGAARLGAGVLGRHVELLGPVRARDGRRGQRGDEVGHEHVPRHGLRVLPQRRAGREHGRQ